MPIHPPTHRINGQTLDRSSIQTLYCTNDDVVKEMLLIAWHDTPLNDIHHPHIHYLISLYVMYVSNYRIQHLVKISIWNGIWQKALGKNSHGITTPAAATPQMSLCPSETNQKQNNDNKNVLISYFQNKINYLLQWGAKICSLHEKRREKKIRPSNPNPIPNITRHSKYKQFDMLTEGDEKFFEWKWIFTINKIQVNFISTVLEMW